MNNVHRSLMIIGILIHLILIGVSFVLLVSQPIDVFLSSLYANVMVLVSLYTIFIVIDFYELSYLTRTWPTDIDMRWVLLFPLILYLTFLVAISFSEEEITLFQWNIFFTFCGTTLLGLLLYFSGRHFMKQYVIEQIERRRRGKRSPIKKKDLRTMAIQGDFAKLCEVLKHDVNFRNRELAAELLSTINGTSINECLLSGLNDEEVSVQLASSISLAKLGNYEGIRILEEVFKSGSKDDKIKIVEAIREIDAEWAVRIVEIYEDECND
ncbi:MAG: HEAT repeat domain-containing protein [Candidatus Thorarchaeota archaeon]|nr:HEAT repeat domain-containing protein [Candidatus Thorarchaeota archaeon]